MLKFPSVFLIVDKPIKSTSNMLNRLQIRLHKNQNVLFFGDTSQGAKFITLGQTYTPIKRIELTFLKNVRQIMEFDLPWR